MYVPDMGSMMAMRWGKIDETDSITYFDSSNMVTTNDHPHFEGSGPHGSKYSVALDSQWVVSYASIIHFGIIFFTVYKLFAIQNFLFLIPPFWGSGPHRSKYLVALDSQWVVSYASIIDFGIIFVTVCRLFAI